MGRLTVELGDDILRQVEAQAATGAQSSEEFISELVARQMLLWERGWASFDRARQNADLTDEEAEEVASREVRAVRRAAKRPASKTDAGGAR